LGHLPRVEPATSTSPVITCTGAIRRSRRGRCDPWLNLNTVSLEKHTLTRSWHIWSCGAQASKPDAAACAVLHRTSSWKPKPKPTCSQDKRARRTPWETLCGMPLLTLNVLAGRSTETRGVPLAGRAVLAPVPIDALPWEEVAVADVVRRHAVPATTMQFEFVIRMLMRMLARFTSKIFHTHGSRSHTQKPSGRVRECTPAHEQTTTAPAVRARDVVARKEVNFRTSAASWRLFSGR